MTVFEIMIILSIGVMGYALNYISKTNKHIAEAILSNAEALSSINDRIGAVNDKHNAYVTYNDKRIKALFKREENLIDCHKQLLEELENIEKWRKQTSALFKELKISFPDIKSPS